MKRYYSYILFFLYLFSFVFADSKTDSVSVVAMNLLHEGKYSESISVFSTLSIDSLSSKASLLCGQACLALNDFQSAIKYFSHAVQLQPFHSGYRFQLAKAYYQNGNVATSQKEYEKILAIDSTYSPALFQLGLLNIELKNYEQAAVCFTAVTQLNPRDFLAYYHLGSSYIFAGNNTDSAIVFLTSSMSLNSEYIPTVRLLASVYFFKKRYDDALRLYEKLQVLQPTNAEYCYRSGLCCAVEGNFSLAIVTFKEAIVRDSTEADYFSQLATAYFNQKQFDSAAYAYKKASLLDNDNAQTFYNLGLTYVKLDSLEEAMQVFKKAIQLYRPDNIAKVFVQMGNAQYLNNNYAVASELYKKALEYSDFEFNAQFFLAASYEQMNNKKKAIQEYKRFIKMFAEDTLLRGKTKEAIDRLQQLKKNSN